MFFLVEMVMGGRVNGDEFLQTSNAAQATHGPLSPSKWLR
jgi:hypothetical protein